MIFGIPLGILSHYGAQPTSHEWVGSCENPKDELTKWVASGGYFRDFNFGPMQFLA